MKAENFKNLKPEQHYSDLYDRSTVEECQRIEKDLSRVEYKPKIKGSKKPKGKELKTIIDLSPILLYFIKGDRYLDKAKTIKEWMDQDRAKDELLASAKPPEAQCLKCGSDLIPNFRQLHDGWPDGKDRVLFMYDCPNGCLPRRAFFNDGEEWRPKPYLCSKCNGEVKGKKKRKGNVITTTYLCSKCGHKEKDVLDLDGKPKPEEPDPDFEKDRKRFCLSPEEGSEYLASQAKFEQLQKTVDGWKEKEKNKELYDNVAKLKKLTVADLQKLLVPALEKEEYVKLELSKPEMGKDVIIEFTVQDSKADRGEYDSRIQLQRLLKRILEKTNWRLMNDGAYYRLGILSGRLKGRDSEEDLLKLI